MSPRCLAWTVPLSLAVWGLVYLVTKALGMAAAAGGM